jgi:hypothetical protein
MIGLRRYYRSLYTEPKIVPAGPFAPGQSLTIIVREGYGAVGIKDALTPAERAGGGIPFRYARLFPDEMAMIEADPNLALLPDRNKPPED